MRNIWFFLIALGLANAAIGATVEDACKQYCAHCGKKIGKKKPFGVCTLCHRTVCAAGCNPLCPVDIKERAW